MTHIKMSSDDDSIGYANISMNKAQRVAIAIIPKVSGSISFICSSFMIYMILQSEVGLGTPFRRIIFIMCLVDIIQSSCAILSTLPIPSNSPGVWGGMGNTVTCDIQGFFFTFASLLASFYIGVLSIHYFLFVQYKIRQDTFRNKIEPFLHGIPIMLALFNAIYLLLAGSLNNAGTLCWIAPLPYHCITQPDVECIRGKNAHMHRWIFAAIPNGLALLITITLMFKIYFVVKKRENAHLKKSKRNIENGDSLFFDSTREKNDDENSMVQPEIMNEMNGSSKEIPTTTEEKDLSRNVIKSLNELSLSEARNMHIANQEKQNDPKQQESKEKKKAARLLGTRSREAMKQAFLFTGSFLICYSWPHIGVLLNAINIEVPYCLHVLLWIFLPLQGLFNIIVFTRPHVARLRQNDKDLNLFLAIWRVVRSGGDLSRQAIHLATLKRIAVVRRQTELKHSSNAHHGPSSTNSKPPSYIHSSAESHISSLGIEKFKDDLSSIAEESGVAFDGDMMYGDNDYDIYDNDGVSFEEEEKISNFDDYDDISYRS
jgi:hypothetical protein